MGAISCSECPVDTFSTALNVSVCVACPLGSSTNGSSGQIECGTCLCTLPFCTENIPIAISMCYSVLRSDSFVMWKTNILILSWLSSYLIWYLGDYLQSALSVTWDGTASRPARYVHRDRSLPWALMCAVRFLLLSHKMKLQYIYIYILLLSD